MKKVQLKNNGQFTIRDLDYFGGKYSFLQRLKMDGVGSSKVIYISGIPYFDELSHFIENETPYVNFELMKNGLLVRLNRNQKTRIIGFQLHEILDVELKTNIRVDENASYRLIIKTLYDDLIQLKVLIQNVKAIRRFFSKSVFEEKFQISFTD